MKRHIIRPESIMISLAQKAKGMPPGSRAQVISIGAMGAEKYRCRIFTDSAGNVTEVIPYGKVVHSIYHSYQEFMENEMARYSNSRECRELKGRLKGEGRGLMNVEERRDMGIPRAPGKLFGDMYAVHFYYELTEAESREVMGRSEFRKAVQELQGREFARAKNGAGTEGPLKD